MSLHLQSVPRSLGSSDLDKIDAHVHGDVHGDVHVRDDGVH